MEWYSSRRVKRRQLNKGTRCQLSAAMAGNTVEYIRENSKSYNGKKAYKYNYNHEQRPESLVSTLWSQSSYQSSKKIHPRYLRQMGSLAGRQLGHAIPSEIRHSVFFRKVIYRVDRF